VRFCKTLPFAGVDHESSNSTGMVLDNLGQTPSLMLGFFTSMFGEFYKCINHQWIVLLVINKHVFIY